jgi:predicted HicB family RNase H-like nuclease
MSEMTLHGKLFLGPYQGYHGEASYEPDDETFYGKVVDTKDVITFEGSNPTELKAAFTGSVDDYLEFCKERGEAPEKPFSGKFLVRITPELHHGLSICAARSEKSLNQHVVDVLSASVRGESSGKTLVTISGGTPVAAIGSLAAGTFLTSSKHMYTFDMPELGSWDDLLTDATTSIAESYTPSPSPLLGGRMSDIVVDFPKVKRTGTAG